MPELPEVETIVRTLAPRLLGRHIRFSEFLAPLVLRYNREPIADRLAGQAIRSIERRGKFIVFILDSGVMVIHLGMTGKLLFDSGRTPYTRAIFSCDGLTLFYDDIRQFGSIEWCPDMPERITRLGAEPFDITPDELFRATRNRRTSIKALLLNQTAVRGLGNIYVDEALWRAGIHPRCIAAKLTRNRTRALHQAILDVLTEAIDCGGSSISNYVDATGRSGSFQARHKVYGREGQPCQRCGLAIRRIIVAQRGTHYCPKCPR
jgi:formamidopyrimidine-DNA glycosylase